MSNNKYVLAVARPKHIEAITKMSIKAFNEGAEGDLTVNPDKVRGTVSMLVHDDHQFAVVAMLNGKPKYGSVSG